MFFWVHLESLSVPRGGIGWGTFSSRPPRAAPYYQRLLYKNKQRGLLNGSNTPRAVGSANSCLGNMPKSRKPTVRFGSVRFVSVPVPVPPVPVRVVVPPVPVHTGSGSYQFRFIPFMVEADPLTGHNLGQISSPRRLSTIFLISEARLFFFKRV